MKKTTSPMQLTRAADYAVRVMVYLAAHASDGRFSLPALALATGTPESFLSKVLQTLAHARLINSRRGQAGGFEISELGRGASMRDVIESVDGPICLNLCLMSARTCRRQATCPAHPIWESAQHAMMEVLASASIAALAAKGQEAAPRHKVCAAESEPALQKLIAR
jgi:Rrf2 family protein